MYKRTLKQQIPTPVASEMALYAVIWGDVTENLHGPLRETLTWGLWNLGGEKVKNKICFLHYMFRLCC